MFEHYTRLYVKEWEQSEKCFSSNKVSMFPVFEFMLRNRLVDQPESPITILKAVACDNKIFLDTFEKSLQKKTARFFGSQKKMPP